MSNFEGNSQFISGKVVPEESEKVDKTIYGEYAGNNPNCISYKDMKVNFNDLTGLDDDECLQTEKTRQSIGPGDYKLSNYNYCDCDMSKIINNATDNPTITFKDGFGISECNVNKSSELRIGKTKKYPRCPNQLFTRPYLTVPYMGRGSGNSFVESNLITGEDTSEKRQCNTLAGVTIDNFFTPLVPNLKDNIQNPNNLIQEINTQKWVGNVHPRGGIPSRQIVKDIDYLQRCGDSLEMKKVLINKKNYLNKH